jgi:uncharacterized protein YndB with AHSA1/START domain
MAAEAVRRIDSASRVMNASPQSIYQAYIDPEALVSWLPPQGMKARIDVYDPREGGAYRKVMTYDQPDHSMPGKMSEHSDVVHGRFLALVQNKRIVQSVVFDSEDPAFAGEMRMTWTLTAAPGGTKVAVRCENVPAGIRSEDHEAGLNWTLENLAVFIEHQLGAPGIISAKPGTP